MPFQPSARQIFFSGEKESPISEPINSGRSRFIFIHAEWKSLNKGGKQI